MCIASWRRLPPWSRLLPLLLATLTIPASAPAATVHFLQFRQLSVDHLDGTPVTPFTPLGEVFLGYTAGPQTEYLNLQAVLPGYPAGPQWLVRNLLLHDDTVGSPYEELAVRFPLEAFGVEGGEPVSAIEYGYSVTAQPLLDADYADWAAATPTIVPAAMSPAWTAVGRAGTQYAGPLLDPLGSVPDSFFDVFDVLTDSTIARIIGCIMDNVELDSTTVLTDKNGCVPAGCANSLDWLRRTDPNINFPGTLRETYNKLSQMMNRNAPQGVWPEAMMQAKLDFIEAYNLPIEVKYQNRFPRSANVTSTSGESAATSHGSGSPPTQAWLEGELADGEDVEANVNFVYIENGVAKYDGGHCVVVTGAGRTAGAGWVFIKHDSDQRSGNPGGLVQVPSGVIVDADDGEMWWPGLGYYKTLPSGAKVFVWPRVDSVISESYKSSVTGPPGSESSPGYCSWFARTIPPNGALQLDYPDEGEGRCYNTTLVRLDRTTTPPTYVIELQWNLNKGKTRTWRNDHPYPVTVYVHNDDHSPDGMDVGVHVAPVVTGAVDPGNPLVFAGFSLGGADGSRSEFAPAELGTIVDAGPIGPGFPLSSVPGHLAEFGGTRHLRLFLDGAAPNIYWDDMGLVVDVLTVLSPGTIIVDCPSTGFQGQIVVTAPGRYELVLGAAAGLPQFEVHLLAQNGLDIYLDALGVPSRVPAQETAVGDDLPPWRPTLTAWPNPFNPSVTLSFSLPQQGAVDLAVFDLRGRLVRTLLRADLAADTHAVTWDGTDDERRDVPAGAYLCRLSVGGETCEELVTLVK